jgi:hypothetical protein
MIREREREREREEYVREEERKKGGVFSAHNSCKHNSLHTQPQQMFKFQEFAIGIYSSG